MLKKVSDYQPVIILGKPIRQVFQCKTLGVTVDENLSWKSNTESICSKILSGMYALKQIKKFVVISPVYNALFQFLKFFFVPKALFQFFFVPNALFQFLCSKITQFLVFPISTRVDITVYQHGKCFIFVK